MNDDTMDERLTTNPQTMKHDSIEDKDDEDKKVEEKEEVGTREELVTAAANDDKDEDIPLGDEGKEKGGMRETIEEQDLMVEQEEEEEEEEEISEYEKRRLEKIKRNQAKLAALGLVQKTKDGNTVSVITSQHQQKIQQQKAARKKSRRSFEPVPESERVTTRKKEKVDYKDKSLREMMKESIGDDVIIVKPSARRRTGDSHNRMQRAQLRPDMVIMNAYDTEIPLNPIVNAEYWRIHRERKQARKVAERNLRAAVLENRVVESQNKKEERKERLDGFKRLLDVANQVRNEALLVKSREADAEKKLRMEKKYALADLLLAKEKYRKCVRDCEKKLHGSLIGNLPNARSIIRKTKEEARAKKKASELSTQTIGSSDKDNKIEANGTSELSKADVPKVRKRFTTTKIIYLDENEVEDQAKEVGGPISVELSKKLQRSWLLEEKISPTLDDLRAYVPQVGDTVLYYAVGHKRFVEAHPDVKINLNRSNKILPWERRGGAGWKQGWDTLRSANEAVLCTVTASTSEFPLDPLSVAEDKSTSKPMHNKVEAPLTKASRARGCKIQHVPKPPIIKKTPVWLNITLSPLCPVSAPCPGKEVAGKKEDSIIVKGNPHVGNENTDQEILNRLTTTEGNSLENAQDENKKKKKIRKRVYNPGKFRLNIFPSALSNFIVPFTWACEYQFTIKPGDIVRKKNAHVSTGSKKKAKIRKGIVKSIYQDLRSTHPLFTRAIPLPDRQALTALVNSSNIDSFTWPTYGGVEVEWEGTGRISQENIWDLVAVEKEGNSTSNIPTPPSILSTFDNMQRISIAKHLSLLSKEKKDLISLFMNPITDAAAPFYDTFVPVGMSFSLILKRLHADSKNGTPYYRSVQSLYRDIDELLANCILYNSPESEIVKLAKDFAILTKEIITGIISGKFREGCIDGRKLDRTLVKQVEPDGSWSRSTVGNDTNVNKVCGSCWVPQAGDHIVYYRQLHEKFVATHADSLFCHQRKLPSIQTATTVKNSDSDVFPGIITEVRYALPPKSLMTSFRKSKLPLFELSIRIFQDAKSNHSIFWRPCLLFNSKDKCLCGVSDIIPSFLRPFWKTFSHSDNSYNGESFVPRGIHFSKIGEIASSLDNLRERCVDGKSLDDLSDLFADEGIDHHHNTRVAKKRLKTTHFLADDSESFSSSVAAPDLCLDLICKRLKRGYYRQEEAVVDEIHASFVTMSTLGLKGNDKVLLPCLDSIVKSNMSDKRILQERYSLMEEDQLEILNNLLQIRKVHAIALVCVSDPELAKRILSANENGRAKTDFDNSNSSGSKLGDEARRIVDALQPDACLNHRILRADESNPSVKVNVRVKGGLPRKTELFHRRHGLPFKKVTAFVSGRNVFQFVQILTKDSQSTSVLLDYTKPIIVEPMHYYGNQKLASALFGNKNRRLPCARCQAKGNGYVNCRVRKGHSNADFDLSLVDEKRLSKVLADLKGNEHNVEDSRNEATDRQRDRLEILDKARLALDLARKTHSEALRQSGEVIALDFPFMDMNFGFDPKDGHYCLCAYCGTGGEMICCESCSRVSHLRCANLSKLPENDWHCHVCANSNGEKNAQKMGRDDSKDTEKLESLLAELRVHRLEKNNQGSDMIENGKKDDDNKVDENENEMKVFDYWRDNTERLSTRSATKQAAKQREKAAKPKKSSAKRKKKDISKIPTKRKRGRPSKDEMAQRKQNDDSHATKYFCPPGWTKTRVQRMTGISAGAWDNLWIAPNGNRYRSRTDVEKMLRRAKEKEMAEIALKSLKKSSTH